MEGVNDVYIMKGTVDEVVFMEFVEAQLLTILNPFQWTKSTFSGCHRQCINSSHR